MLFIYIFKQYIIFFRFEITHFKFPFRISSKLRVYVEGEVVGGGTPGTPRMTPFSDLDLNLKAKDQGY